MINNDKNVRLVYGAYRSICFTRWSNDWRSLRIYIYLRVKLCGNFYSYYCKIDRRKNIFSIVLFPSNMYQTSHDLRSSILTRLKFSVILYICACVKRQKIVENLRIEKIIKSMREKCEESWILEIRENKIIIEKFAYRNVFIESMRGKCDES